MNPDKLLDGFDTNGMLGELTEIPETEHNKLFQKAMNDAQVTLGQAIVQARVESKPIILDASRLSGTNGFDNWIVNPKGDTERILVPFEQAKKQLEQRDGIQLEGHHDSDHRTQDVARLFARMAYNGLWSPSGTNWQPIRTIVMDRYEASALPGVSISTPAMVVFTRTKYSSILGDVASLCGIAHDPHAEYIDLGIWMQIAIQTAIGHGWTMTWRSLPGHAAKFLVKFLKKRSRQLPNPYSKAAAQLAISMEEGKHIPAYVLFAERSDRLADCPEAPAMLSRSDFDMLIESRSTQRVASPSGMLSHADIQSLWDAALGNIRPHWSKIDLALRFFSFSKTDPVPAAIGKAMKNGIEGPDGLLAKIRMENLMAHIQDCPTESEPLMAASLPEHLLGNLTSSGQYRIEDGLVLDHRGKALTPSRLVKLMRMLAKSFGRFFLSFQNTHPALGVIMVRADLPVHEQLKAYEYAGRVAGHMSALARAKGWVSIIKSGPIEIARSEIQRLMAENTTEKRVAEAIKAEKLRALLTFQIGLPLGPHELVSKGTKGEHNGILERKLDKRASRASVKRHHIPMAGD